jgi:hypothetical protein
MPVITESGVVGLVSGTTPGASKVLLVVDPQSRVDAYIERTRARGTVRGTSGHDCDFEYVLREENLEQGDVLLTSGMGTVYPKGLVVGRVASVDRKTSGLFLSAKIAPAVDFSRLEEVFVILEQRQIPEEESFSAADEGLWPASPKSGAPAKTAAAAAPKPAPPAKPEKAAKPAEKAPKAAAPKPEVPPAPVAPPAEPAAPPPAPSADPPE